MHHLPWDGSSHWQQLVHVDGESGPRMQLARQGTVQPGSGGFEEQLSLSANTFSVVNIMRVKHDKVVRGPDVRVVTAAAVA